MKYQVWWDREMASNAVVMPVVFNFQGTACRALKLDPSRDEYYWVAADVASVLYPVESKRPGGAPGGGAGGGGGGGGGGSRR
jgi:uncharacterized membrane protein YgcG